jgi:hypothetical protein
MDLGFFAYLAGNYGVKGFPTIKFMYHDGSSIKAVDYKGGRTAKEIIVFGMEKARNLALKRIGESANSSGSSGSQGSANSGLPLLLFYCSKVDSNCHCPGGLRLQ